MSNNTIVINGRSYDAATGLLVNENIEMRSEANITSAKNDAISNVAARPSVQTSKIHAPTQQKSQTLRRQSVIKQSPVNKPSLKADMAPHSQQKPVAKSNSVVRSPEIRKFAPHPVTSQKIQTKTLMDIAPQPHHPSIKAAAQQAAKADVQAAPRALKPAQAIKDEAIDRALTQAVTNHRQYKAPKRKASRILSVASASLAILLLGGYFTYLNMPNLSVRVAAASAGIDASYPEYQPDGYRLNGPIASNDDKVTMKFASNSGPQNFTLSQQKSSWDSVAVQDHVNQISDSGAMTTTVDGLTIYIYGSNAAWVNGGILYSIEGDAPLSGDQIRRIATSL